jgi:cell wall assembly regulator SMI1
VYLIHDGIGMPAAWRGFAQRSYLLCLSDALDAWSALTKLLHDGKFDHSKVEASGPVRAHWWNSRWLPVTADSLGNHYCIDMDPDPGGTPGQIVSFWHADVDRSVEAPNLAAFLSQHVDVREWAALAEDDAR